MDKSRLRHLLDDVASGQLEVQAALDQLRGMPFEDLGFAKIDHHRALRTGFPEVIFCPGKTPEQVSRIAAAMREQTSRPKSCKLVSLRLRSTGVAQCS